MLLEGPLSCEAVERVCLCLAGDGLADLPSRTSSFRGVCFFPSEAIVKCLAGGAVQGGDCVNVC